MSMLLVFVVSIVLMLIGIMLLVFAPSHVSGGLLRLLCTDPLLPEHFYQEKIAFIDVLPFLLA